MGNDNNTFLTYGDFLVRNKAIDFWWVLGIEQEIQRHSLTAITVHELNGIAYITRMGTTYLALL